MSSSVPWRPADARRSESTVKPEMSTSTTVPSAGMRRASGADPSSSRGTRVAADTPPLMSGIAIEGSCAGPARGAQKRGGSAWPRTLCAIARSDHAVPGDSRPDEGCRQGSARGSRTGIPVHHSPLTLGPMAYPRTMTTGRDTDRGAGGERVRQVRPATEGWKQKKDAEGKPLLQFASPKRGKPPGAPRRPDARRARREGQGARASRLPREAAREALLHALDARPGRDDRPAGGGSRGVRPRHASAAADRGATARDRPRRHHQVPVEAARRRPRRVGADALPRSHHALRVLAGRMRHELPVLRHRPGGSHPQHVGCRDHRADRPRQPADRRRRPGRQEARRPRPPSASRTSSSWAWASRSRTTPGSCRPCA